MNAQDRQERSVTVIVVNYYSLDELQQCLTHLRQSQFEGRLEIMVVNNSPGDGTAECLAQSFAEVVYLEPGQNLGFGPACNYGIERASGDHILLVNPDAFVPPEAIENAVRYFEEHDRVGVIGVRLTAEDGGWHPSARGFPSVFDKLMVLSGLTVRYPQSRLFGRLDHTWWDHSHPKRVDWVVGAFFMIRGSVARRLVGFDPRFFIYFEEMEFCRRVRHELGMEVHFVPCATVRHVGGASSTGEHMDEAAVDGKQISHFRMFSEALYYGKYYGRLGAAIMLGVEWAWTRLRLLRNAKETEKGRALAKHAAKIRLALRETRWGTVVPPAPWRTDLDTYAHWKGV